MTTAEIFLDPAVAREQRDRRVRSFHVTTIPLLRVIGFNLLAFGILIHSTHVPGFSTDNFLRYLLSVEIYSALSWLILYLLRNHNWLPGVATFLLTLDMVPLTFAVYLTGGEKSWIYFVLLAHVVDHSASTFRRVLYFAALALISYAALLLYLDLVEQRNFVWWQELITKGVFLPFMAIYAALAARVVEALRGRTAAAIRVARSSLAELELASKQLQASYEEAAQANRAKSEFLSRVSHELRTPLNAVLGFAQMLQAEVRTSAERESVDDILGAGHHLLGLVDELLDLSALDSGKLALAMEAVDVATTIKEAAAMVQGSAADREVALDVKIAAVPPVYADKERLRQVLLNLLSNAVKYNRPQGKIVVSAEKTSAGTIRILVSDTGYGIPHAMLQRLFRPFDRLGAERGGTPGVGLGLSIAKALVERMAGRLEIVDTSEMGTTFAIELPASTEGAVDIRSTALSAPDPVRQDRHATVLYIEDHDANIRLVRRILARRPNINLLVATDGVSGLDLAATTNPDLILLDLNLPDISGYEVLQQLGATPAGGAVPVIIVSGNALPGQAEQLLASGAVAYVTKPFNVNEFLKLVDEHLHIA